MADVIHTKATLDGLYKDVYDGKLDSLVPDFGILVKMIKFNAAKKTGRDFVKAVKLSNEHGFTYGSGMATLQDIISSDVDDAKVRGSSLTLRSGFSYDSAANMASDAVAFENATKFRFRAMMEAATHRLEAQILYGSSGLGIADSSQDSVTDVVNTTQVVIPIKPASWAAGIWAGQEGALVALFTVAANAASAAIGNDGTTANKFEIASIDNNAKTITVKTASNAQALALVAEIEAADYNIFYRGAANDSTGAYSIQEMVGIKSIVSNTGSLFGVDGAAYGLWQGNTYDVSVGGGTNLTLKKVLQGVNMAVSKGLREDVVLLVSPATFATMADDEASLRRYGAEKQSGRGTDNIVFQGTSGKIEVVVHPMVKEGEAMAFPKAKCERIGATDLTFKTPGKEGEEMFLQSPTYTGYEVRLYSEQAVFLPCPSHCVLFSNISNA